MAGSLQDIQLNIVLTTQGLSSTQAATRALRGVWQSANNVNQQAKAGPKHWWGWYTSLGNLRDRLSGVERGMDAVFRAGVHMKALGGDLLNISRDLVGIGKGVIAAYEDYDYWLRRASVALNTNATFSKLLDDEMKNVATSIGLLKPQEVAEAFNVWGAATGVTVDSMEDLRFVSDAVKDVIIATAGAGGSLESNLRGVSAILGQFNMDMSQAGHVTRVLTLMTERTQADFGDLAQAFSYVGPLAHSLGVEFDDVAQMLGALADAGIKGSRAGRGLSMVIEGLSSPSAKAEKALNLVVNGFKKGKREWANVAFPKGDFIGMNDLVIEMAKGLFNATDAQRGYVYSTAFTNNATRALIPLVERTIELWRKDSKAMKDRKTILDESKYSLENAGVFFQNMTETMTGSIKAVIGSFKNAFFPIIQMVAMRIMELAGPVFDEVKKRLDAFRKWLEANPWFVDMAVKVGALIAVVAGLAGAFFSVAGTLILLGAGIGVVVASFGPLLLIFGAITAAIAGFAVAVASDMHGIREAFADFLAQARRVFVLFFGDADDFKATMASLRETLGSIGSGAVKVLADTLRWLADVMSRLDEEDIERIRKVAKAFLLFFAARRAMRLFLGTTTGLINFVNSGILKVLTADLAGLAGGVRRFLGSVLLLRQVQGLNTAIGSFVFLLRQIPKALIIGTGIGAVIVGLLTAYETNFLGFRDFVDGVVKWVIDNVVPKIVAFVQEWGPRVAEFIGMVADHIRGFIEQHGPTIVAFVQTLIGYITDFVGRVVGAVQTVVQWIMDNVVPPLQAFVAWAVQTFGPLFAQIGATIGAFIEFVLTFIGKLGEAFIWLATNIGPIIGEFFEAVGALIGMLADVLGPVIDLFLQIAAVIVDDVLPALGPLGAFVAEVIKFFGELVGTVLGLIGDFITNFQDYFATGFAIVTGIVGTFVEGGIAIIKNLIETVVNIVKGFFGVLENVFKLGTAILKGDWSGAWNAIKGIVGNVVETIKSVVGGFLTNLGVIFDTGLKVVTGIFETVFGLEPGSIYAAIKGFIDTIIGFGRDVIGGLVKGVGDAVGGAVKSVQNFVGDIIDGVKSFLGISSPAKIMLSIGKNIVYGLWQGILSVKDWIINKVWNFIKSVIPGPVLDALGIHSPSRVMAELGRYAVEGLAVGIESSTAALRAMESYTNTLVGIASGGSADISSALSSTVSGGSFAFTADNEQTIRLQVEVTSPDGSISSLTAQQIADLINGGSLVSALEHMAAVND